jgi:hypothetical protein
VKFTESQTQILNAAGIGPLSEVVTLNVTSLVAAIPACGAFLLAGVTSGVTSVGAGVSTRASSVVTGVTSGATSVATGVAPGSSSVCALAGAQNPPESMAMTISRPAVERILPVPIKHCPLVIDCAKVSNDPSDNIP